MRVNGTMFSNVFIPAFVALFTCGCSWVGSTPDSGSGVWSTPGNASGVAGRRRRSSSAPGNDSWVKHDLLLLPLPPPPAGPQRRDVLSTTLQQAEALTDAHTLPGALPRSTIDESPEPGESAASPGSAELRRASSKAENREKAREPTADGQSPETPEEKSSLAPLSLGPPAQLADALWSKTAKVSLRPAPVSDLPLEAFNDSIVYLDTSSTSPSVATEATSDDRVFFPGAWSTPSSAESQATPGDTQAYPPPQTTSATPPSAETIVFPSGTTPLSATTPTPSTPPPATPPLTTEDPNGTTSDEADVNDKVSIIVPPRPCPGPCEVSNEGVCVVDLLCQERQTNGP